MPILSNFTRAKERKQAAVDQRHLKRKDYITESPSKSRMIVRRAPWKLTQAHGVSTKTIFATHHKIWSSPRDQPGGCPFFQTRRCRRSVWKCVRRSWWWSPRIFHHLRQCSHFWWVGGGLRRSWPASPSPWRSPRRSRRGRGWEITQRRRLPRCSSGDTSAVRRAWRSPTPTWRKTKNRKWLNYNYFFYWGQKITCLCINPSTGHIFELQQRGFTTPQHMIYWGIELEETIEYTLRETSHKSTPRLKKVDF
jgi:hypothetical protein